MRTYQISSDCTISCPHSPDKLASSSRMSLIHRRSAATEEMESYLNLSRGTAVELMRELCSSRLNMNGRGTALASTGHQVQFYADQVRELGWRAYITLTVGSRRKKNYRTVSSFLQAIGGRFDWLEEPCRVSGASRRTLSVGVRSNSGEKHHRRHARHSLFRYPLIPPAPWWCTSYMFWRDCGTT